MTFAKNESVWITFHRPADFRLEETLESLANFDTKDKVEAKIIRDKEDEDEYIIELLTPELCGYWWNLKKNRFSVTKHSCFLPDYKKQYTSSRELSCKRITNEMFDLGGSLLSQLEEKPWAQDGDGNVPFNPDGFFTYENHWAQIICALRLLPGVPIEVDSEAWDYFLGVIPPLRMKCYCHIDGHAWRLSYLMGEGSPFTGGFVREGKYYLIGVPGDTLVSKTDDPTIGGVTANYLFYRDH
jgi:hypothetical protein